MLFGNFGMLEFCDDCVQFNGHGIIFVLAMINEFPDPFFHYDGTTLGWDPSKLVLEKKYLHRIWDLFIS
jgi:hypothetical protein